MMPPRTLTADEELIALFIEWAFTYGRLKAHPVTENLAAELEPLRQEWQEVFLSHLKLTDAKGIADAQVDVEDEFLDLLFNAFIHALLVAVNNDRTATLYQRFVTAGQRPAELRAPVLGPQLALAGQWQKTLEEVQVESLKAFAEPFKARVATCTAAEEAEDKAEQALANFLEIGAVPAFVERLNGARKLMFGKLSELKHKHPDLPSDFPERFFLRPTRSRGPTIAGEERTIKRLEKQLARHKEILDGLKTKQAAQEKLQRDIETAALQVERETLQKEAAAVQARLAEIEAQLK